MVVDRKGQVTRVQFETIEVRCNMDGAARVSVINEMKRRLSVTLRPPRGSRSRGVKRSAVRPSKSGSWSSAAGRATFRWRESEMTNDDGSASPSLDLPPKRTLTPAAKRLSRDGGRPRTAADPLTIENKPLTPQAWFVAGPVRNPISPTSQTPT